MNEVDKEIDRWNQRLRNLGDDQFANERELRRHERLQDEVDYVHRQGDWLFQVMGGLAEERAQMEREKRMLVERESDYYEARRKLALGGERA